MTKDRLTPGYMSITWLIGMVFADRGFVDRLQVEGLDAVYKDCPYDDLRPDQRATFEDCMDRWELRLLVKVWWVVYDYLRKYGKIRASDPWR